MRNDSERLRDILEAIERIEKYTSNGRKAFEESELIQTWTLHHLQIIGEAVRALSSETIESAPLVEWPSIIGMRNILVHNYFDVDIDIVWSAVENDLPILKGTIGELIEQSPGNSPS